MSRASLTIARRLVKQAFVDPAFSGHDLSSANSINVGRLIPQSVYYVYAVSRVKSDLPICVCVPSGNFGNLMGGLIAKYRGLPIERFIAAVNSNDEFPVYLRSAEYQPIVPSRNCLSNAMNVGHPSNLARLVALYGGNMDEKGFINESPDLDAIHRDILSVEIDDIETRAAIADAHRRFGLVIEPHGAVGFSAIEKLGVADKYATILLETADPAKFPEIVRETIGADPEMPESMKRQQSLPEKKRDCANDYEAFKEILAEILEG